MFIARNHLLALLVLVVLSSEAQARQSFLDEWRSIYPTSSSSRRDCQLCHADSSGGQPWNGYGFDIRARYIEINRLDMRTAILDAEELDSDADADNLTNIQEIQLNYDPGWRAPGLNFILFSDMSFDQVPSPFSDTDRKDTDFCFALTIPEPNRTVTLCL